MFQNLAFIITATSLSCQQVKYAQYKDGIKLSSSFIFICILMFDTCILSHCQSVLRKKIPLSVSSHVFLYLCPSIDVIWHCDICCSSPETFCSHLSYICELSQWPTALVHWHGTSSLVKLIGPWGIWQQHQIIKFQTHFNNWYLKYSLENCYQVNATTPHWLLVKIGSGNGLVPSGNKPLHEPMLTQIFVAMWSLGRNELMPSRNLPRIIILYVPEKHLHCGCSMGYTATRVQLSAVITRSNIKWYCTYKCSKIYLILYYLDQVKT